MNKATAISPANIAFIKYWGQRDSELVLPYTDSVSMNLSECYTTTTVAFDTSFDDDSVGIQFYGQERQEATGTVKQRVLSQVDRFRALQGVNEPVRVESINSFPAGAGIASSASAFSALTVALAAATKWEGSQKELSILTRLAGSGSATRSIFNGFVQWHAGDGSDSSYAEQLADEKHWDLRDIVVVVDDAEKKVTSLGGHSLAETSPLFTARVKNIPNRVAAVVQAIKDKNLTLLGETIEQEAVSMHAVCMTSQPPVFYWNDTSMRIMKELHAWREDGVMGYFTFDAGPNAHIICEVDFVDQLSKKLQQLPGVRELFINKPAKGAHLSDDHLF